MRFTRPRWIPATLIVPLALALGCGGGEQAEDAGMAEEPAEEMPAEPATVRITQPEEGSTVGPDVLVVMETDGIEIFPIARHVAGTGHHHLYVDVDLTPLSEMIPQDDPQIIHMGDGSAEYMLEGLAPGEHRLIAVVANPGHVPISPPIVDTLHFTVANEP